MIVSLCRHSLRLATLGVSVPQAVGAMGTLGVSVCAFRACRYFFGRGRLAASRLWRSAASLIRFLTPLPFFAKYDISFDTFSVGSGQSMYHYTIRNSKIEISFRHNMYLT